MEEIDVKNNPNQSRFEATVNGALCYVAYELGPGRIVVTHTEVPPAAGGRGVGGRLAEAALDHARRENLRVVPQCAFFASYIKRHGEKYGDLVST